MDVKKALETFSSVERTDEIEVSGILALYGGGESSRATIEQSERSGPVLELEGGVDICGHFEQAPISKVGGGTTWLVYSGTFTLVKEGGRWHMCNGKLFLRSGNEYHFTLR